VLTTVTWTINLPPRQLNGSNSIRQLIGSNFPKSKTSPTGVPILNLRRSALVWTNTPRRFTQQFPARENFCTRCANTNMHVAAFNVFV